MAHSDIFLCGQSNDAMLAAGVYSVIKDKKGVVKYFLEQLDCRENFLISLGRSYTPVRGLPKQKDESVQ